MKTINELIGQLFIIGFKGDAPSSSFLDFFAEEKIGGAILFKDNCSTHEKVRENSALLSKASDDKHPFIAVDQEGGRVSRISGLPAEISSPKTYAESLGILRFSEDYLRSMLYLESLGVNLNLAPVCDIFINDKNSCLDGRCFGKTANEVVPFITKAVEISKKSNILSCLKHFPGLGDASIDPHKETTVSYYDEAIWEKREGIVFEKGIAAGADMVMTTHIKLPKFDDEIATGSFTIIERFLRQRLSYDGVVITDDLQMMGANCLGEIGERTIRAFNSGHDLLLFGQDTDSAMEALEHFRGAFSRGEITEKRIRKSLDRISALKFKIANSVLF